MKNLIVGLLSLAALPLAWKIVPILWQSYAKTTVNAKIVAGLVKIRGLWKGHEGELKAGIAEAASELEEDVDAAAKAPEPAPAAITQTAAPVVPAPAPAAVSAPAAGPAPSGAPGSGAASPSQPGDKNA